MSARRMPCAFNLEHTDRLATRHHLIRFRIVERQVGEIDVDAAAFDVLHRQIENGERFQAEEVELHQSRRFDPFHVELGHRHQRFRIAVEWHELGQRPVADDDAGRVRRRVARESFELLRDVEGAPHHLVAVARGLQTRFVVDRPAESDRIKRILRHQLAELVDLAIRHLQHASDVAQHAARLQSAEGDDLRHLFASVFFLHVADHLVAPVLTEIDVEVRHGDAFGIEEAFEQKPEADRIEIGDCERVGNERAGAGAAARADRNALRLRPLDEIGDDEEVAGIFHALDDAELEGEAVVILLSGMAGRDQMPP